MKSRPLGAISPERVVNTACPPLALSFSNFIPSTLAQPLNLIQPISPWSSPAFSTESHSCNSIYLPTDHQPIVGTEAYTSPRSSPTLLYSSYFPPSASLLDPLAPSCFDLCRSSKGLVPGRVICPAMGEGIFAPLIHLGQGVDPKGDTPPSPPVDHLGPIYLPSGILDPIASSYDHPLVFASVAHSDLVAPPPLRIQPVLPSHAVPVEMSLHGGEIPIFKPINTTPLIPPVPDYPHVNPFPSELCRHKQYYHWS